MTIKVGDRLPELPLTIATSEGPRPTTTGDYFGGRKVALFAVPGAYTPTCSAKHLPSYVEKAADLRAKGVAEIACTSVNDAFVMAAWNREQGSEDITMIADGNGQLAEALGLTMDASKFGMGAVRSQRYSMIVNDGVVEQLNVEVPGEYKASSAESLLEQL
jgi:peroxiredoxin